MQRAPLFAAALLASITLLPGVGTGIPQPPAAPERSPRAVTDALWPDLLYSRDPVLQKGLKCTLGELGLARAASRGQLAVALVDITRPDNPRMAAVNAHEAMYAASLPKIAILLGAFQKAADGRLKLDAAAIDQLTAMIRASSNEAATAMLERVGFEYLADILTRRYGLYDPALNGGLWVGKPYARSTAWRRDPLHNLSHAATVYETARYYYLLETGQLVSPQASAHMKEILGEPAIAHKFVAGLADSRPGSRIFRKSGSWREWHSDSAIIERDGRRYIAVALARHPSASRWLSSLIVGLDDLIFDPANIARDARPLRAFTTLAQRSLDPAG